MNKQCDIFAYWLFEHVSVAFMYTVDATLTTNPAVTDVGEGKRIVLKILHVLLYNWILCWVVVCASTNGPMLSNYIKRLPHRGPQTN